jgi:hypothetical protein
LIVQGSKNRGRNQRRRETRGRPGSGTGNHRVKVAGIDTTERTQVGEECDGAVRIFRAEKVILAIREGAIHGVNRSILPKVERGYDAEFPETAQILSDTAN